MQPERKERENDAVCDPQRRRDRGAGRKRWPKRCTAARSSPLRAISVRERRRSPADLRADSAMPDARDQPDLYHRQRISRGGRLPLFHFDMYRLGTSDELFDIGWEDYLQRGGVCAVEWSENVRGRAWRRRDLGAHRPRCRTATTAARITIDGRRGWMRTSWPLRSSAKAASAVAAARRATCCLGEASI